MSLLLTLNLCQVGGLYFSRDNLKELSRSLGINRQLMPVRKIYQVQIILKDKSTSNNDLFPGWPRLCRLHEELERDPGRSDNALLSWQSCGLPR